MPMREYARVFKRRRVTILVFVLLALAVSGYLAGAARGSYVARTQLFVTSAGSGSVDTVLQNGNLAQARVPSYVALVNSPDVLRAVNERLHEPASSPTAAAITASNPLGTALIDVTVKDRSAAHAYDVAVAIGQVFPDVVEQLETPRSGGTSPIKISVVRDAEVPLTPSTPPRPLYVLGGLVLGLAVGLGAAMVRDSFDTAVRSSDQLQREFDLAPLGSIVVERDVHRAPLVVDDAASPARAESFRQLRTNLQYSAAAGGLHSLVVTSAVAREGKSLTAVNLAITLGLAGSRILLVEADLRSGHFRQLLGLADSPGLTGVLARHVAAEDAIQRWRNGLIDVLPAGATPPNPSELLGSEAMGELLLALETSYDVVVIDAPPLLPVTDAVVLAARASATLLVVRRNRTDHDQVRDAVQQVRSVNGRLVGAVLIDDRTHRSARRRRYASTRRRQRASMVPASQLTDVGLAPRG